MKAGRTSRAQGGALHDDLRHSGPTPTSKMISVLLACRCPEQAGLLCERLARTPGDAITAQATSLRHVVQRAARTAPDVVMLECRSQEERVAGVLIAQLANASPRSSVLVLCEEHDAASLLSFVRHGARGCLLASSTPSLYAKAAAAVCAGQAWFGRADLVDALRLQMRAHAPGLRAVNADEERGLTPREREIMGLIGTGLTNKEIGRLLGISDHTVKTHLHHVYVKLDRSGRYKAFLAHPEKVRVANGPG
jgi:DNA-binding NarL/FixJ family response regulator